MCPYIQYDYLHGATTGHRAWEGPFETREEAEAALARFDEPNAQRTRAQQIISRHGKGDVRVFKPEIVDEIPNQGT
jgi:hypothetical protein